MNFISQMNTDMVASMPEAYRAIVDSRPAWSTGAFALAIFGGALGCLLLLLGKPATFYVFTASVIGAVVAQIPFVSTAGLPIEALIGGLSQVVIGSFLIWYSKRSERKDWIR